ncbi:hypothetical protein TV39_05060 [Arthrobacter sp. SPG23]|nr:hypothetical protein TV39_05060 [Arthrobacter sp. SPG23]
MHHHPRTDATGPSDDDAVSHSVVSQTPEDILAYWTQERMAESEPREIRLPEPEAEAEPEEN